MSSNILGIDPGLRTTGYGAITTTGNRESREVIGCGVIETPSEMDFQNRLQVIHDAVQQLLGKYQPGIVAVEELYFSKNVKTAIDVGHARGAIMLALSDDDIEVEEFNPLTVKKTLTGNGNADKKAVQRMVRQELDLQKPPSPNDAADALAVALSHHLRDQFESQT